MKFLMALLTQITDIQLLIICVCVVVIVIFCIHRAEVIEFPRDANGKMTIKIVFKKFGKATDKLIKEREEIFLGIPPVPLESLPANKGQPAREIVLDAWKELRNLRIDVATLDDKGLNKTSGVRQNINVLKSAKLINSDQANILLGYYDLGKELHDKESKSPSQKKAIQYSESLGALVGWVKAEIEHYREDQIPKPVRKTSVGGYNPPNQIHPRLALKGVKGTVEGKNFNVQKEHFYIGAQPGNDLVINGDDYVSGNHACLRSDEKVVFLADQNSRNGTFLNGKRLQDAAIPVKAGDEIRIGSSVLMVIEA